MKQRLLTAAIASILACGVAAASMREYTLSSPSGILRAEAGVGDSLTLSLVDSAGRVLLSPSTIGLKWIDNKEWGRDCRVNKVLRSSAHDTISAPFYKKSRVEDSYNGITLKMKDGYDVEIRLYDDGLAYRFVNSGGKRGQVESEKAVYRLPSDCEMTVPYVRNRKKKQDAPYEELFWNDMQSQYTSTPMSELKKGRLMFTPLLADMGYGVLAFAEADVESWPGMYLTVSDEDYTLEGVSAPRPSAITGGGHNDVEHMVVARCPYIAEVTGRRVMPWRAFIYTPDVCRLPENDMVYRLASPSRIEDVSWIQPGKVAWDWWNDWGVYNVDFKAGINTPTYLKFIDFAAGHGIEYVIMDEGWATKGANDLFDIVPAIDMDAILEHASAKGVGIILWAGFRPMIENLDEVCERYAAKGVKGFKIDFLNRDDQQMIEDMYRIAEVCAKHKLLVDFHGCCKPSGLQRTWPNVVNYEAVFGLEQLKWSKPDVDQLTYDVTLPFIRSIAGPMDYTPGAMRNAVPGQYYPCRSNPMSQGTRCHQLAEFIVFDSPLTMMCDSPTNYEREPECTAFIAEIPTTYADTRVLCGKPGEYIVMVRESGDGTFYIGALTGRDSRSAEISLDFLPEGNFTIEEFSDGVNASRQASDYRRVARTADRTQRLKIEMAPGGGYAASIKRN
ncbi:MAG: glycoside hydrolase family 97 protein [Bacteroidales bacterium]|nr:glycoside hydrolase family 97 protein [Bacteroidales bacterium]